jgi:hypothetical protein
MAEPPRTPRTDARGGARARPRRGRYPGEESEPAPAADRSEWERVRRGSEGFGRSEDARPAPDLSALAGLLGSVRSVVPPELDQQVTALIREVLLTLRALIDWYLERLDGTRPERRVEDIPIE